MRYLILVFATLLSLFNSTLNAESKPLNAYQFSFRSLYGKPLPLSQYKGKVILLVNTASKCGYTPQYKGLQQLYQQYKDDGLVVIGVPSADFANQEFSQPMKVASFTQDNYHVAFPLTAISHVKGSKAHPLYQWSQQQLGREGVPKWNFHKLLIDRKGNLVQAFPSSVKPLSKPMLDSIQSELNK